MKKDTKKDDPVVIYLRQIARATKLKEFRMSLRKK